MDLANNSKNHSHQKIGCGMYAISDNLEKAWTKLFNGFQINTPAGSVSPTLGNIDIDFSTEDDVYAAKNCLFAQTCGFPYLKKWQKSHAIICVPKFDIEGCQGLNYRSWFIKKKTNSKNKLEDFQNTRVAINSWASNSGMNVLRFAVSQLNVSDSFFSEVQLTGAHHQSVLSVAAGKAEIASIDAVTFYFLAQTYPELIKEVEIFDQSVPTPGLPFISHRDSVFTAKEITSALNRALKKSLTLSQDRLKISSFEEVTESSYLEIQELENQSVNNGYPALA